MITLECEAPLVDKARGAELFANNDSVDVTSRLTEATSHEQYTPPNV